MSHKPTYPNIAIGGSSVYAYGIIERSHGRLPGKEECSTSDIRYREMLFSGCAETIYGILQENISVSGIDGFGLTVQ